MEQVAERIIKAFEGRGYEFLDRDGERVIFRKGAEGLSVRLLQEPLTVDKLPQVPPGERQLLIVLAGADLRSLSEAETRGVEIWDRDRFRREVGGLLLDEAMERSAPMVETEGPGTVDGGGIEEGVAEPTLTREQAMAMAAAVNPFRCEMVHVPWYLLQLEVKGRERRRIALAVNALTGQVQPWRKWVGVRKEPQWSHVAREPKIDFARARELAIAALGTLLASSETRELKQGFVVVRKDFDASSAEGVEVTGSCLFQMPHWCVEGVKGVVVINAATGAVVEESYFEKPPG